MWRIMALSWVVGWGCTGGRALPLGLKQGFEVVSKLRWGLFLCAYALCLLVACFGDRRDGRGHSWRARPSFTCSLMRCVLGPVLFMSGWWFLYGGTLGGNAPTSCVGGFAFVASFFFLDVNSGDSFVFVFPHFFVVFWVGRGSFLHCSLDNIVVIGGDNALVALGTSTLGTAWPCARLTTIPIDWHVPLDAFG